MLKGNSTTRKNWSSYELAEVPLGLPAMMVGYDSTTAGTELVDVTELVVVVSVVDAVLDVVVMVLRD